MKKNKTVKQKLRSNFLWLHRWLGLISGIVFLLYPSPTACMYFKKNAGIFFSKNIFM
jgi:hypothetical protein